VEDLLPGVTLEVARPVPGADDDLHGRVHPEDNPERKVRGAAARTETPVYVRPSRARSSWLRWLSSCAAMSVTQSSKVMRPRVAWMLPRCHCTGVSRLRNASVSCRRGTGARLWRASCGTGS